MKIKTAVLAAVGALINKLFPTDPPSDCVTTLKNEVDDSQKLVLSGIGQ